MKKSISQALDRLLPKKTQKNQKKKEKSEKMTKKQEKKLKMGFNPYKKGGHNRIEIRTFISCGNLHYCKFYKPSNHSCTKRNGFSLKKDLPCLYKIKNQHKCPKAEFIDENKD